MVRATTEPTHKIHKLGRSITASDAIRRGYRGNNIKHFPLGVVYMLPRCLGPERPKEVFDIIPTQHGNPINHLSG